MECKIDGCACPVTKRKTAQLCEKHYMRLYRKGHTELAERTLKPRMHSGGYWMVPAKGHPMADGNGHCYEHRLVFYDHHKGVCPNCHWCGSPRQWDVMHVDHLNDNKRDNRVENLACACPECNQKRGRHKIKATWARKSGLEYRGRKLSVLDIARLAGISRHAILARLDKGWSVEQAVETPRGKYGPRRDDCNMGKGSRDDTDFRPA